MWGILILLYLILWKNVVITHTSDLLNFKDIFQYLNNMRAIPEFALHFILPFNNFALIVFSTYISLIGLIIIISLLYFGFKLNLESKKNFIFGLMFILLLIPNFIYLRNINTAQQCYDFLTHRAYLPSIGLLIVLTELINYILKNYNKKIKNILFSSIIISFSISTIYTSNYYSSMDNFIESLKENYPNSSEAYYLSGFIYSDAKNNKAAIIDYNTALKLDPNNIYALNNRGCLKSSNNDYFGSL